MMVDGFRGGVHCGVRVLFVDGVIFVCEHFVAFVPDDMILATVSSSVWNSQEPSRSYNELLNQIVMPSVMY